MVWAVGGLTGCSIGHAAFSTNKYPKRPTERVSCVGRTSVAVLDTAAVILALTMLRDDSEHGGASDWSSDEGWNVDYTEAGNTIGGIFAAGAAVSALIGWARAVDCYDANTHYESSRVPLKPMTPAVAVSDSPEPETSPPRFANSQLDCTLHIGKIREAAVERGIAFDPTRVRLACRKFLVQ
jgi:hypothetical protein